MAAIVKKPAMKAKIPFIPNDIMVNIFKRLSVRSLFRCQCVCKNWKNLIRNLFKTSSFIKDHLHYSRRNHSLLLQHTFHSTRLSLLDCDMRVCRVQNLPSIYSSFNCKVMGSCNGLVCVKMVDNGIYPHSLLIWNPVTREVRKVRPRTIIDSKLSDDYLGFGFNPHDNDYKIVRIDVLCPFNIKAVEVYSLNSGSWKELDFEDNLNGVSIMSPRNVTINGVMFWDTRWWRDDVDQILSVDLSKEVCKLMPMEMPYIIFTAPKSLIEYENKLGMVACIEGKSGSNLIHFWVLEEDTYASKDSGKRWEWIKILTSGPCSCQDLYPMTIWKNEIVLVPLDQIENDGQTTILYLLNLTTNEFRRQRLAVRSYTYGFGQRRNERHFNYNGRNIEIDIFNYVESLESVGNIDIEEL